MSQTIEGGTELAILPRASLPTILAADDSNIFGRLFEELKDFSGDISTARGRAEIASKARKVAVAKMDLIRLADGLKEDAIKKQRAINEEVKVVREKMDALRDPVRAPLDEFEAAEEARIKANDHAIAAIEALTDRLDDLTSEEIVARLSSIQPFDWSPEYRSRGERAQSGVTAQLQMGLQAALAREAAAAEAERLAAEKVERDRLAAIEVQRQREGRIAAEAAEQARIAAEERAQAALQEAEAIRRREANEAAERERIAAEALAEAERNRREAAERAEAARVAAEQQAERDRVAAVEAERKRVADEEAARKAAADRRAADRAHRGRINREVLAGFVAAGLDETIARIAVEAIAKAAIPHVFIQY